MRYLLTIMLALLVYGCEQVEPVDEPAGQGAWLTLGRSGFAGVFVRYTTGETEKWIAPYSTVFGRDGKSLEITLRSEKCGEMQFQSVIDSDDLTRVNTTESVARALPCRLNTTEAPKWKLLTKVVNSAAK